MSARAKEVEELKRKAGEFLEGAKRALDSRQFDLSCFLYEQGLQLTLKSGLLAKLETFPGRTPCASCWGSSVRTSPRWRVSSGGTGPGSRAWKTPMSWPGIQKRGTPRPTRPTPQSSAGRS
ncbi:MAG: HEPN domain-containing protein [Nitrososphaerota archaeon]|nr:HEPN domain-containing protein [Nitrososphaerota archaeon]